MKALLKNQKYIVSIFLTTFLFIGTFSAGYIQAQNVGEPITLKIVPVSERTPQVRDAIVAAVPGVDAAATVTETHLAGITALSLNNRNITSLKSGDFDGLTGLQELLLYDNQLTSLPEDIFSGLSSLRTLRFGLNQLTTLPANLFDGLTVLTDLRMIGNQLTSSPDDSGKNTAAATPVSFQVTVNDPFTPFAGLTVSPGKVAFRAGGILLQAGGCIVMGGTFNNVRYDTHSFKWQRRENPASPWIDIPGTEVEDGICGYRPDRPGQYRVVWDVSINGVRKKYASANILIVE